MTKTSPPVWLVRGDDPVLVDDAVTKLLRECLPLLGQDVGNDDPGAFLDEFAHVRGAHALCAPGDQGDLILQQTHFVLLRG